jgi:hypothetical protein
MGKQEKIYKGSEGCGGAVELLRHPLKWKVVKSRFRSFNRVILYCIL